MPLTLLSQPQITDPVREFFDAAYRKHDRYWLRRSGDVPVDEQGEGMHAALFKRLRERGTAEGNALDAGTGEGADAIRLARLGLTVDAVDVSSVALEKADAFAASRNSRITWHHGDICAFRLSVEYDLILCSGLLHYVGDKAALLGMFREHIKPGGLLAASVFSNTSQVPLCHQVIPVIPDSEGGWLEAAAEGWEILFLRYEREKRDRSHPGFPPHVHSYIKLLARRPTSDLS